MATDVTAEVVQVLRDVLRLGPRADALDASSPLLGGLPEFDSMAVVSLVAALEEFYGVSFDDDEIRGETFETVGTLAEVVRNKIGG